MPRGADYAGPAEALDRYRAVVDASGNGEVKGAKNPYTSRHGHMFSFLDQDGTMALRLSPELEAEFRDRYPGSGPIEQYGRTMKGYSTVPPDLLANREEILTWYDRAWDWIGTLAPKPTTRKA
ncbi:MAG: hypothetical protein R2695_19855 [Acidimicrobiales bacterium]